MTVRRGRQRNPGCTWFLFFWGGILALVLVVMEIFSPVSIVDKVQQKWALVGEKTKQRIEYERHHQRRR